MRGKYNVLHVKLYSPTVEDLFFINTLLKKEDFKIENQNIEVQSKVQTKKKRKEKKHLCKGKSKETLYSYLTYLLFL